MSSILSRPPCVKPSLTHGLNWLDNKLVLRHVPWWPLLGLLYGRPFLHAKPWIPGGRISLFMVVIHWWRSIWRQFAHARTIDKYDVIIPVPCIHVTSQINCGDVTMPSQKRLSLATMAKLAIYDSFSWFVCSGHKIACKNWNNVCVTLNCDFFITSEAIWAMIFTSDDTRENHCWIASLVTKLLMVTNTSFYKSLRWSHCYSFEDRVPAGTPSNLQMNCSDFNIRQ